MYADVAQENICQRPLSGWYVMEQDIYDLNREYRENQEFDNNDAINFLLNRAEQYSQGYYEKPENERQFMSSNCMVVDENGYILFWVYNVDVYSFIILILSRLVFVGGRYINYGEEISINVEEDELRTFMEQYKAWLQEQAEAYEFVNAHLEKTDYAGIIIDSDTGKLCVTLYNEEKIELLEGAGIDWKMSSASAEELHKEMNDLWDAREDFHILRAERVADEISVQKVWHPSEEEDEAIQEYAEQVSFVYYSTIEELSKLEDLEQFLLVKSKEIQGKTFEKLKKWIKKVAIDFPEYTYENLWTLGCMGVGAEYYDYRSNQLEKFVEGIPYEKNEEDPFDESDYGDPKHLAIKVVLQKYKEIYPLESYETLYEKYLKEVNESCNYTQKQKRSYYRWQILKADEQIKELLQIQAEKNTNTAILGSVVLFAGVVVMQVIKRRKIAT